MSNNSAKQALPLWIDSATGHLTLGDHVRLHGGMPEASALACVASLVPTSEKVGNVHTAFTVRELSLGGLPAYLTCRFKSHVLYAAAFGVVLPDPELIDGWPSRNTSEREVAVIRSALRGMLGASFDATQTFRWGDVYAGIQDRDMMASAGIRYAQVGNVEEI